MVADGGVSAGFDIAVTLRERLPFPGTLLVRLPRLTHAAPNGPASVGDLAEFPPETAIRRPGGRASPRPAEATGEY